MFAVSAQWQFTGWAPLVESWLAQRLDLGLGDWGMGEKPVSFHHEMESFFVVSDNQPFKGMVDGDHHIPPIDISKMVKLGMVSYSNGNSRILKWSYLLVLYHISGHMNWGYFP
jgi:hypothetical protein